MKLLIKKFTFTAILAMASVALISCENSAPELETTQQTDDTKQVNQVNQVNWVNDTNQVN